MNLSADTSTPNLATLFEAAGVTGTSKFSNLTAKTIATGGKYNIDYLNDTRLDYVQSLAGIDWFSGTGVNVGVGLFRQNG